MRGINRKQHLTMAGVYGWSQGGAVNNYVLLVHLPLLREIIMACMEKQSPQYGLNHALYGKHRVQPVTMEYMEK